MTNKELHIKDNGVESVKLVYFLGVGGIGMSALARYFLAQNKLVFGYDRTKSKLCQELQEEGITITYEDAIDFINKHKLEPKHCLCVYTPALPKELNLIQAFRMIKAISSIIRASWQ